MNFRLVASSSNGKFSKWEINSCSLGFGYRSFTDMDTCRRGVLSVSVLLWQGMIVSDFKRTNLCCEIITYRPKICVSCITQLLPACHCFKSHCSLTESWSLKLWLRLKLLDFLCRLFLLKLPSDFLPPTSIAVLPHLLGSTFRPVNPGSLLAPFRSFYLSCGHLFLCPHLAPVVTSQSIFRTSVDVAGKRCGPVHTDRKDLLKCIGHTTIIAASILII